MARIRCNICGTIVENGVKLVEHMKRRHIGRLSKQSIRYLRSLGVSEEKIRRVMHEKS